MFASSDNSIAVYLTAANEIQISQYDTTEKVATTTSTFTSTSNYYYLSVVFDSVTPSSSKIFVDGIDETLATNTLTSTIDATTNDYYLGSNGSSLYLEATVDQFSINTATELLTEHITWTNNEVLPSAIFSDIVKLLNIDTDPLYDRVNENFAAIDLVNPVVSNKVFDVNFTNRGLFIDDNATMNSIISSYFSVSMYVKVTSEAGLKSMFAKWNTSLINSLSVYYNVNNIYLSQNESGSSKVCIGANKMVFGEWIHIVGVWEGTSSQIYINNVASKTFNNMTDTVPDATVADYVLGQPASGLTTADYDLRFLEMISKPLTALEVSELYNSGRPISAGDSTFSSNLKFQANPETLKWNGLFFSGVDSVSSQEIYSMNAASDTDLMYGGLNIAVSRNLTEFNKECSGVVSKGETIDLVFTNGQSNDYGAEALTSVPADYQGERVDLQRWNGSSYVNVELSASISNPLAVTGTYAYQPSMINKFIANSGRSLYLHSYSASSTRLAEDTGSDWNTNSVAEYFDLSATERVSSEALLVNNDINVVAEVWNQNENDCIVEAWANAYEVNLTNYINKRRLAYPNIKFVIVLVHSALPIGSFPYKATVKAAQLAVAAALPNVVTIDQDAFSSQVDNVHRDAAGYEALGNAIYEQIKIA